jgi:hypothetical protein
MSTVVSLTLMAAILRQIKGSDLPRPRDWRCEVQRDFDDAVQAREAWVP